MSIGWKMCQFFYSKMFIVRLVSAVRPSSVSDNLKGIVPSRAMTFHWISHIKVKVPSQSLAWVRDLDYFVVKSISETSLMFPLFHNPSITSIAHNRIKDCILYIRPFHTLFIPNLVAAIFRFYVRVIF